MKREIFSRPTRMQHKFGAIRDTNDPMESQAFKPSFPKFPDMRSPAILAKDHGEHYYRDDPSPVVTPAGRRASFNGPAPDEAEQFARPIPAGTKRRKDTLKTDK